NPLSGNQERAIPANSLRGMIGSLMEGLSQSTMRVLDDEDKTRYSVRKAADTPLKTLGLIQIDEKKQYTLIPVWGGAFGNLKVNGKKLDPELCCYQHNHYRDEHNENAEPYYCYRRGGRTGNAHEPANEIIIAKALIEEQHRKNAGLRINQEVIKNFERVLNEQWQIKFSADGNRSPAEQLESLNLLPVGYASHQGRFGENPASNGQAPPIRLLDGDLLYYGDRMMRETTIVDEVAFSAIWRGTVKGTLHEKLEAQGGENLLPWNPKRSALTPAEAMLGVVEHGNNEGQVRNLASRINFADGFAESPPQDTGCQRLRILASPKPPSPAMYFHFASPDNLINRDKGINRQKLDLTNSFVRANGRKIYPPQPLALESERSPWITQVSCESDPNRNCKQFIECKPIAANTELEFTIDYENLSDAELGLLLRALMPAEQHPSDREPTFVHRLGLGKPIGLGHVALSIEAVDSIQRKTRYTPDGLNSSRYQNQEALPFDDSLVDPDSLKALRVAGNPQSFAGHPVSYPLSAGQNYGSEEDGYQWFVNNDKLDNPQSLGPIDPNADTPPTLKRN
ncbi:TIGR03986 family CRISPR-associated RAMP protein, partial [Gammaproteobacteria bacterium]|nr:TIGR03986 family CRISPR-associated RAMP protein [Gammaproteobacteria bacterium]